MGSKLIVSEIISMLQNPEETQVSKKSSAINLSLSTRILNLILFKNFETTPKLVIVFNSCLAKFLFVQMICLDSVRRINATCFLNFGS